ncbi:type II toxin-antitoxin system HicB family antitoxin [Candidatus Falkowbacteria bacterium]|nr:type II toxin-antitoxin system HicB family antitoxin [Candidatus Falkowbacteria bacterium]
MKKYYQFPIVVERDEDGYFVYCPQLDGCMSQGDTYQEALSNIKEAVELYVEDMTEDEMRSSKSDSVSLTTVGISI